MTSAEFLDQVWWGNPVSRWLLATLVSVLVIVALLPVKRSILKRLRKITLETATHASGNPHEFSLRVKGIQASSDTTRERFESEEVISSGIPDDLQ